MAGDGGVGVDGPLLGKGGERLLSVNERKKERNAVGPLVSGGERTHLSSKTIKIPGFFYLIYASESAAVRTLS